MSKAQQAGKPALQKIKDESREGVTTVIDKKDERPTSNVQHRTSNEKKSANQQS